MKILYFLTNYPFYSETFISAEIDQLREKGHIPVICNFTFATNDQLNSRHKIINNTKSLVALVSAIVKNIQDNQSLFLNRKFWVAVISSCYKNPVFAFKYVFMLLSADYMLVQARKENADLVVNHFLFKSTLAGSFIAQKIGVPNHIRLHTKRYLYSDTVLIKILKEASKLSAIAVDVKRFYEEKMENLRSIDVIRQSVDVAFLSNMDQPKVEKAMFTILAIGRLTKKKGFDQLILAVSKLERSTKKKLQLKIYGEGSEKQYLSELIEKYKLHNQITLEGKKPHKELMVSLSNSSLLVVPSIELQDDIDGIPTVIIEAMLMKVAVVAYDTASISEIVIPNETGFLVPSNDVEALTQKLEQLITDESDLAVVKENAYQKVLKEYASTLANDI
ncbi:MAG: glycosyltransferase [Bacteroidia bacterium]